MRSAVLTGGTGMIASALANILAQAGVKVYCVIRPGSERLQNIPKHDRVHIVECDLSNLSALPELIGEQCSAFFHFGWSGTYGEARNDVFLQNLNIKYTLDAVKAAKLMGCGVFVGAGSQAEYGRVAQNLKSDTPTNPENGYGIAKYAAGKLSRIYCRKLGIRHVWARILSVYGPGDNSFTLIMSCIRAFLTGEHMAFTPGEQLWDYLYADDAARAFRLIAEKGRDGAVYSLGSGQARPLREFILAARNAANPHAFPGIGELPYPSGQVMRLCADISELKEDTGFSPSVSFDEGIRNTVEWVRKNSTRVFPEF